MSSDYDVDSARPPSQGPGLLTAIRRHPFLVIACAVIAAALGGIATLALPTHYSAQARIVLGDSNQVTIFRTVPVLNATAKAQNAAQIMRSQAVYDAASAILKHRLSPSDVSGNVSIAPADANPLVTVTATENSAKLARDVANAESRAYLTVTKAQAKARATRAEAALQQSQSQSQDQLQSVNDQADARAAELRKQASSIVSPADRARFVQAALGSDPAFQSLKNQATALTTSLSAVKEKLRETKIDASLLSSGVDTLYAATTPSDSTSPTIKRNIAIGAALGLLIGAALAWRRLDRERGVDQEQIAATLGAPQLGTVKRDRELRIPTLVVDLSPDRQLPNDLRVLATSLILHMRRRGLGGSVITSAEPGEGKTVLALNLAAAASSAGHDVVLIDGDVRNAALTRAFGMDASPGLLDLLEGAHLSQFGELSYAPNRTLPIIPVGSRRDDVEPPMSGLPSLRRADGTAPAAIVDSPAIFEDPVTLWLASAAAGLVVIVSAATTLDALRTLRSRAELAGAPILGFIVNDARPQRRPIGRLSRSHRYRRGKPVATPASVPSSFSTAAGAHAPTV